jgi:parallel beta-helix repeat protein
MLQGRISRLAPAYPTTKCMRVVPTMHVDCVFRLPSLYGVVVQHGGETVSEGNRISGNKHAGVLVHGSGSRCRLKDSDVSGNGEMGVGVQKVSHAIRFGFSAIRCSFNAEREGKNSPPLDIPYYTLHWENPSPLIPFLNT